MTRRATSKARKSRWVVDELSVFLNIPYDKTFSNLFLAYIAGIACFGLRTRATLEIPGGERRLDRILELIQTCRFSIHDLSRVELDRTPPPTPRFNMPFELGLAVAIAKVNPDARKDTWFVLESVNRRIQKSLSDLNGTEIYIHEGTVSGVFRELNNAFFRTQRKPTVRQMQSVFDSLKKNVPQLKRDAGTSDLFTTRMFGDLVLSAQALAAIHIR
jgi:hypothetical protein